MKIGVFSFVTSTLIIISFLSLSACNTVQGVGEDFKAAGQVIKETAEDTKRKIQR